jgi:hypothetical protein
LCSGRVVQSHAVAASSRAGRLSACKSQAVFYALARQSEYSSHRSPDPSTDTPPPPSSPHTPISSRTIGTWVQPTGIGDDNTATSTPTPPPQRRRQCSRYEPYRPSTSAHLLFVRVPCEWQSPDNRDGAAHPNHGVRHRHPGEHLQPLHRIRRFTHARAMPCECNTHTHAHAHTHTHTAPTTCFCSRHLRAAHRQFILRCACVCGHLDAHALCFGHSLTALLHC